MQIEVFDFVTQFDVQLFGTRYVSQSVNKGFQFENLFGIRIIQF